MDSSRRLIKAWVLGAGMLLAATAQFAWACTAQPTITLGAASITRGPLEVTAKSSTSGPVEIRWNSADGQVLGKSSTGLFSGTVQIPADASPGYYYVVALFKQDATGAAITGKISEIVEVTKFSGPNGAASALAGGRPDSRVSTDLWGGFAASNNSLSAGQGAHVADSSPNANASLAIGLGLTAVSGVSLAVAAIVVSRRKRSLLRANS